VFTDVLALCAKAGVISVGLVGVDGSLIAGNASPGATKTYDTIRQDVEQMLEQAARADADDDQQFGQTRGDELPPELIERNSRRQRLARCNAELEAEQAQQQAEYEANLLWRAEWEAPHARKLGGRKPVAPATDALAKRTINTTDPDSRPMRRAGRRTVQGYNAQVVASPQQIILAAEITQAANDSGQLEPMIHHALGVLAGAGIDEHLEVVLADGGYWNSSQIARLHQQEIPPIVPTKSRTRTAPRRLSPRQGPEARRVEHVLGTPEGQALYRRRQQIVEPIFAQTKILRRIDRFQRRGLAACTPDGSSSPLLTTCSRSGAWHRPRSPPDPATSAACAADTSRSCGAPARNKPRRWRGLCNRLFGRVLSLACFGQERPEKALHSQPLAPDWPQRCTLDE